MIVHVGNQPDTCLINDSLLFIKFNTFYETFKNVCVVICKFGIPSYVKVATEVTLVWRENLYIALTKHSAPLSDSTIDITTLTAPSRPQTGTNMIIL